MFGYKKITAFLTSLLICIPSVVTAVNAFADNETETSAETVSEETTENVQSADDTTDAEDESIVSGDFIYSVIDDSSICIKGCTSTETSLVIPDTIDGMTVTELSSTAFGDTPDRPYETISIPATVTYISTDNPFMYCQLLKEIIVSPDNTEYITEDGVLYTSDKTLLMCYPPHKDGNSLDIPEGVETLGVASIYNTQLTEIKFPSSLETINRFALGGNLKIKSFDFGNTVVTELGILSCSGCTLLNEVILPDTLSEIESGAFMECSSLEEIILPDGLSYVGQYAFTATNIKKVTIPDSVTDIDYCAFGYVDENTPMSDFVIVGSVNSAAYTYAKDKDEAYDYKNDFTFITPEADAEQSEYDSLDKDIYEDFEYAVMDGEAMITDCVSSESKIEIPSEINGMSVTRIYRSAFENSKAEEIIIPESVKTIDRQAFYNCTSLKTLIINGAETIGEGAFVMCSSLTDITISGNCKTIEGEEPFVSCSLLESITVTDGDGNYSSENGILYNKDKSILLAYPVAKSGKEFKVPSGVTEISISAFCNNSYLETADLSGVERIGDYAFEGSKKLTKAILSDSLKSVGIYAFADCSAMTSIRVPESVVTVGDYAFGYKFDNSGNSAGTDNMTTAGEFKIYAEKDSRAYQYAKSCNIEVVSGTVELFGKNIVKGFLWAVGGTLAALIAVLVGFGIFRKIKKKGK